jgi:hypothetical protein
MIVLPSFPLILLLNKVLAIISCLNKRLVKTPAAEQAIYALLKTAL